MDAQALIIVIIVLLVMLVLLVLTFVLSGKQAKKHRKVHAKKTGTLPQKKVPKRSFAEIKAAMKAKVSTAEDLKLAIDELIEHFGVITPKLGARPHPDFDKYMDLLFTITRHPNTNKHLIIDFEGALKRKNEAYAKEIEDAIQRGLSSRGL